MKLFTLLTLNGQDVKFDMNGQIRQFSLNSFQDGSVFVYWIEIM